MMDITDLSGNPRAQQLARQMREEWKRTRPKMFRELQGSGELEPMVTERALRIALAEERLYDQILEKNPIPPNKSHLERAAHLNWVQVTARELMQDQVLLPPEAI